MYLRSMLLFFLSLFLLSTCEKEEGLKLEKGDYLIFGHFYGKCIGEQCVETFKLTEDQLFEDSRDDFSGTEFNFSLLLGEDKFRQVRELKDIFPNQLLQTGDTTFGCPNCADQGGFLLQYAENGRIKTWRIDPVEENIPDYLHLFSEKLREKIDLLQ
ncbi:MAG: hypothetical protein RL386_607 [Bacteroidota bacterium]